MGRVRGRLKQLRVFTRGSRIERELDEELSIHIEMETEKNLREGMSAEDARRSALVAFGGVERTKERVREARWTRWLQDTIGDVRYTLRTSARSLGFTAAVVLVLGIGVGAVSLMFSTYDAVVLRPLPFPNPGSLVWVWAKTPDGGRNSISYDDYVDYRDGTKAFRALGALEVFSDRRLLTDGDKPQQVTGYNVSANLFQVLGVAPALGRGFIASDETRGTDDVVILSHHLWVTRYGADTHLVGRTITMDGRPVEVVGVMPAGFDYPDGTGLWTPLQRSERYASGRANNNFFAIGRLRTGVTLAEAQTEVAVVARHIAEAYPAAKASWGVQLQSLHDRYFGRAGSTILLLMGIITLVPLVACANVASLFMARSVTRRTEIASRLALGAPRSRIVRQLVTESIIVALGGGGVGLGLAYAGGAVLRSVAPAALPRLDTIGIDGNVVAFTLAVTLLMVPLFGLLPALRGTEVDIGETLKSGGRGDPGRRLGGRSTLVVAQVALAVMLTLASGMLLRGYLELQSEKPGFRTADMTYGRVSLPSFKYDDAVQVARSWDDLMTRIRAIPGVLAVGAVDRPPLSGAGPTNEVWAAQRPPATAADKRDATRRVVAGTYFEALGIPVMAGRTFKEADERAGRPVTVISEALARRYFPGENPVGQTLVLDWSSPVDLTILGVIGDVNEEGPGVAPEPMFYLPTWFLPPLTMYAVAHVRGPIAGLGVSWKAALHAIDPDIPDAQVHPLEDRLSAALFQPKFRSTLVSVFALVSLILSAIGLYGVLSFFVRQHGHELGVRLALGASGGRVARLVVGRGLTLVGSGILIGLSAGFAVAEVARGRGWLPGIDVRAPETYVLVALCLLGVALAACALPAARALRIDPVGVMRSE